MENDIGVADRSGGWLRPKAGRFDQISIIFHWLSVALVTAQLGTGSLFYEGFGNPALLLAVHRLMGALTWIVVAVRLLWRRRFAYLPPYPEGMPRLQQQIAMLNEYGLYGLLLLQPLTGLAMMLFRGRPFDLFLWQVPAVLTKDLAVSDLFRSIHQFGAGALLALIGLHAAAALLHAIVLRDGVFQRMLPWTARSL